MSSSFSAEFPPSATENCFFLYLGNWKELFSPPVVANVVTPSFEEKKKTPPPSNVGDETEKERDDLFKVRSQFRWREIVMETMSSISGLQPRGTPV